MALRIKYITALKGNGILKGKKLNFAFLEPEYLSIVTKLWVLIAGRGRDFVSTIMSILALGST
jgi:hypothetical protein